MLRSIGPLVLTLLLTAGLAHAQGEGMAPMEEAYYEVVELGPYATYEGGEVTHADLNARFSEREGFARPLSWRPGQVADDLARRIAWERLHMDEALTEGVERGWVSEERITQARRQVLYSNMIQHALAQVETPTEEEMREHHAAHPEDYTTPFRFHMRHLFLPTYISARVQEGDTPTSITERVSGDPELARGIRLLNHQALVANADVLTLEEVDRIGGNRFRPGMTLWIPMNEQSRQEVRDRLQAIRASIETEEDFIAACQEHTEGDGEEIGPLPDREADFLPELLEAARGLEVGEVSEILDTKHGVQLILLTQMQPEEPLPFEEVRDEVVRSMIAERRIEAVRAWVAEMMELSGAELVELPRGSMRGIRGDDTVLVDFPGDDDFTTRDLVDEYNALNPTVKLRWVENALGFMLNQLFTVHSDALEQECGRGDYEWIEPILEQQRLILAANTHLNTMLRERALDFTEEDLQRYHEENGDRFRPSALADYWQIIRRLDTSLRDEAHQMDADRQINLLQEEMEGVDSLEDFKALIPSLSDDFTGDDVSLEIAHRTDVPTRTLGAVLDEAFQGAEEDSLLGPLKSGWAVLAIWVESIEIAEVPPLEDVREQAEGQLGRQRYNRMRTEMQSEELEEIEFTLVREDHGETEAP